MKILHKILTVYESPFNKVRFGNNQDGGYVGVNIETDILLSGGIGNNISFELDYITFNGTRSICADSLFGNGSHENMDDFLKNTPFIKHPLFSSITFVDKLIGANNDNRFTNFSEYINSHDNISMKLDIEGAEFDYISSLSTEQLNKISQLFVEVHWIDKLKDYNFFHKLNETHILIHLHGNNCGLNLKEEDKVFTMDGVKVPKVLECTFLHKKYFNVFTLNKQPLPCNLDFPNQPRCNDLSLNYPPFVNNS